MNFSSYAKWILTGEHSVIHGGRAIVFPLKRFCNNLCFSSTSELRVKDINFINARKQIIKLINIASDNTNIPLKEFIGEYNICSTIPMQVGLGSSAAFCANIVKLCQFFGYSGDIISLGRVLENEFHTNSSGLDVAVSILEKPLIFENNNVNQIIDIPNIPCFTLTYSGKSSNTAHCVEIVQNLFITNKKLALELEKKMNISVGLCIEGLRNYDLKELSEGINLGAQVFKEWGLFNQSLDNTIKNLKRLGALASKPIGAGLGGYVVSLWNKWNENLSYCNSIRLTLDNY